MIKKREAIGIALFAFGVGLVLAVLLQSGLCPVLLGLISIIAGCVFMHC